MSNITMYDIGLEQAVKNIVTMGSKRTILFQGHIGSGKSSMLDMVHQHPDLQEEYKHKDGTVKSRPTHIPFYFDCTTKLDSGDVVIPKMKELDKCDYFRFATNEELGVHIDKPIILIIDEYGKGNRSLQNSMLRLMLERKMGNRSLHPDSIIFATTNLADEGVGDLLPNHARNRITVSRMRKPDADELIEFGYNTGRIDPIVMGWVKDNPHVLQSYEDVHNPQDNEYIFHPRQHRDAFVTPRSIEAASDWIIKRDKVDTVSLTNALVGTVGAPAAMSMLAFIKFADELPKLEDIKRDPENAKIPTSAAAVCLVVYRTLSTIETSWVPAWVKYMRRLDAEAQGLFGKSAAKANYSKRNVVFSKKEFMEWAREKSYLFSADKV